MTRTTTTMVAVLAGAALLFAGCSSTSGTPSPAGGTTPVAAGSGAASPGATSSSDMSSGEVASSAAPASSSALDAQTTAWFTVACNGLTPLTDASATIGSLSGAASTDPTTAIKKVSGLLVQVGASLTKAAGQLKQLPAPTVSGGGNLSSQTIAAYTAAGAEISAAAEKIKADPTSMMALITSLQGSFTKAAEPINELSKLPPETVAAIEKLPACVKIAALAGG